MSPGKEAHQTRTSLEQHRSTYREPTKKTGAEARERKDLRPGQSEKGGRPTRTSINRQPSAVYVERLRSNKGAREEATRNRPPGVPYPIWTKETDGGARERSKEEESKGIACFGDETARLATGPIDTAGGSVTNPVSDVAWQAQAQSALCGGASCEPWCAWLPEIST